MVNKKVLIVGSGGREHALAWKLSQSATAGPLYVAPGNAGTAELATNVPIQATDVVALLDFARSESIDLTVVGPEAPLADGIVDAFDDAGLVIFGPSRAAARLESSKAFAKAFLLEHNIPTALASTHTNYEEAVAAVRDAGGNVVVKASGLAAGKGVIVCDNVDQAEEALHQMLVDRAFGAAGEEVIVEERLHGPELSLLAFCDGQTAVPMLPARDHKRVYDGDQGPNTGGMGAYAPPPDVDAALVEAIMETVIKPTVAGMAAQDTPYVGVLYAGLMLTTEGPKVLEFNCRFGDPETQVLLPLLDGDLLAIMTACVEGRLTPDLVRRHEGACVTVVMAAPGYPASYSKDLPIGGVAEANATGAVVFHAGTRRENGQLLTAGGRVLAVTARGTDVGDAADRAYAGVEEIHFPDAHYRTDIGRRGV